MGNLANEKNIYMTSAQTKSFVLLICDIGCCCFDKTGATVINQRRVKSMKIDRLLTTFGDAGHAPSSVKVTFFFF